MQYGRLTEKKDGRLLFIGCWLVYFTLYTGRHNLSAVVPAMIQDGVVTEAVYGTIAMCFFLAYGCGQLVNGLLGDKISPFKLVFTGIFLSGIMNLCMALLPGFFPGASAVMLAVCWGLNGYFQSMIWSPLIRIIANVMPCEQRVSASVNMSSSTVVGTLAAYLASSAALAYFGWQAAFIFASVLQISAGAIWTIISLKTVKNTKNTVGVIDTIQVNTVKFGKKGFPSLLVYSGILLVSLPVALQGMLNYGVTSWVPTIISTNFTVKPQYATLLTMILPAVNLLGAYICHVADKKLFKNEMKTCALFFGVAGISLAVMYFFIDKSLFVIVAALAIITSAMTAVNVLCLTFVPMYFGSRGRASSVAGILDAIAYIGCAASTYGIGYYIEHSHNWANTVLLWGIIAVCALILSVVASKRWGKFRRENEIE